MRGRSGIVVTSLMVLVLAGLSSPAQAAFPGQNGKIAFSRSSVDCIYTVNPNGTNETPVMPCEQDSERTPRWSPDGQQIAFLPDANASTEIGLVNADGTNVRRHFYDLGAVIVGHGWSPDGSRIAMLAFTGGVGGQFSAIAVIDSSDASDVGDRGLGPVGQIEGLDWSPDGSRIAVGVNSQIYAVQSDLTTVTQVAPGSPGINLMPSWSPSGNRIAFESTRDGNREIYVMNSDGTGQTRLTTNGADDGAPRWSPDGSKIVFHSNRDGNYEIYVMNADGTGQTRLTNNALDDKHPDWQPIPINVYPRPKGATPFRASLTTAYNQCTAPDRTHGPPLAFPSCASPQKSSAHLTVGTGDSNGLPARNEGFLRLNTMVGAPGGPDDADVGIELFMDDVFTNALADYGGEIRAHVALRITDKDNTPHPGGPGAATTTEIPLDVIAPCIGVAAPQDGSVCAVSTTADALAPGTVKESRRSIWQVSRAEVYDGGPDGDANTPSGDTLFATQGIFIP